MSAAVFASPEGSTHHLAVSPGLPAVDLGGKKSLTTMKPSNTVTTVKPSGSAGYVSAWKRPGPRMCEAVSVNPENTGNYISAFRRQFPFLLSTDPTLFPQDPKHGAGLWVTFPVDFIYTSYECSSHEKRVVWGSVQGHVDLAYRYNFPLRRGEVRVVWEFGQRCSTACPWQKPRIDLSVAGWVLNKLCHHLRRNYYPASLTPSSGSTCSGHSLAGGSAWGSAWGRRQLANQVVRDHATTNCEVCSYSWQCPRRRQCHVQPGEGTGQLEFIDWTFLDENDHVHML